MDNAIWLEKENERSFGDAPTPGLPASLEEELEATIASIEETKELDEMGVQAVKERIVGKLRAWVKNKESEFANGESMVNMTDCEKFKAELESH